MSASLIPTPESISWVVERGLVYSLLAKTQRVQRSGFQATALQQ